MVKSSSPETSRVLWLLFKLNGNAEVAELSGILKAVCRVSGKAGYGLRDYHVNFPLLAVCNHALELLAVAGACACYALVGVNLHKLVFGMSGGIILVVGHLVLEAQKLVFIVGGYTAICRELDFSFSDGGSVDRFPPSGDVLDFSCHLTLLLYGQFSDASFSASSKP